MINRTTYAELKKVASYYMSNERVNHTLCPTALVNEAYLKLHGKLNGKGHDNESDYSLVDFKTHAARNMRQILVNHALARNALKRGGGQATKIILDDKIPNPTVELDVLHLDDALTRLEQIDPTKSRIVELRYFTGLSNHEVAEQLNISVSTVKRKWTGARAWLYREMS